MKKNKIVLLFFLIILVSVLAIAIFSNDKTNLQNNVVCYRYDNNQKEYMIIEHVHNKINFVISKTIEKHSNLSDVATSKQIYDELCKYGNYYFCDSYIIENNLILIEEMSFQPSEQLLELNKYIKYLKDNNYKCIK